MPSQYVATDSRTGLAIQVTGEFPDDTGERVRIARTVNLFTKLLATILITEGREQRELRFRALETQLETADALARGDMDEVRRLARETLRQMGLTDEQLREATQQLRDEIERMTGRPLEGELDWLFESQEGGAEEPPDSSED
ncbi:MAG TPA: hypothetical protein VNL92_08230 [Dehalococcoidia bacterium]|nr:hypothetical protein [Dehalococcoidia bacterium]